MKKRYKNGKSLFGEKRQKELEKTGTIHIPITAL